MWFLTSTLIVSWKKTVKINKQGKHTNTWLCWSVWHQNGRLSCHNHYHSGQSQLDLINVSWPLARKIWKYMSGTLKYKHLTANNWHMHINAINMKLHTVVRSHKIVSFFFPTLTEVHLESNIIENCLRNHTFSFLKMPVSEKQCSW